MNRGSGIAALRTHIRKKPWLVELLPFIGRGTSTALYPHVYVSSAVFADIFSDNPDPYHVCVLLHEEEHIARMRALGVARWYLYYLASPRFRIEEELAATKPQLAYIKQLGLTFNLERNARALASWLYLWAIPYADAMQRLQTLWDKA